MAYLLEKLLGSKTAKGQIYSPAANMTLIVSYIAMGAALGSITFFTYDYSAAISFCLGGMLSLGFGLLHVALWPKSMKLSKEEAAKYDNAISNLAAKIDESEQKMLEMREELLEESRMREEKIVGELKDLAVSIAKFALANKTNNIQQNHSRNIPEDLPKRRNYKEKTLFEKIREALAASRIEVHLQPIVSLPQRRVSFYECFTRLRDEDGNIIMPSEFLKIAENSGMVSEIDNMLLIRCIQLARSLVKRDRRISIFCNISPLSLGDEQFFGQFIDFLRQNRDLGGSIIFEISREAFERLSMTAERNIGRLFDIGYRFSIDRCETIDLDLRRLERMGVRYVKIAGEKLVSQLLRDGMRPITGLSREFEAYDVAALFARYGVDLIADKIETERTVVEILELDLSFAQGNLFGSPHPIGDIIESDTRESLRRKSA